MKALVYTGRERLVHKDVPDPEVLAPGEQNVRVAFAGICGSDLHAFKGHDERRPAPLILGHEASGVISGGDRDGERVVINPLVSCGSCPACARGRENLCSRREIISMPPREGAFAQWVAIPQSNLISVPESVSLRSAALTEPMACGWHAIRLGLEALGDSTGARLLVIGGGTIGLGVALSAQAVGIEAVTLVETNRLRRSFLVDKCGQRALVAKELASELFDLIVDAVGIEDSRALASSRVKPGGVILNIGLGSAASGLDLRRMTLQEVTFIGTYTYTVSDFAQTAKAIFAGRLGALDWVETRALSEGQQAFLDLDAGRSSRPKILLIPD